jgi:hypothetical protein
MHVPSEDNCASWIQLAELSRESFRELVLVTSLSESEQESEPASEALSEVELDSEDDLMTW